MTVVKITYKGEIRRLTIDIEQRDCFSGLTAVLVQLFDKLMPEQHAHIHLQWTDQDGDVITVSSDAELIEAVHSMTEVIPQSTQRNSIPRFELVVSNSEPVITASNTSTGSALPRAVPCTTVPSVAEKGAVITGPYGGFVRGYCYSTDGKHSYDSLEEAIAAAANTSDCRAITKEIGGKFTLRKKRNLWQTKTGELTWIVQPDAVNHRRQCKQDQKEMNLRKVEKKRSADERNNKTNKQQNGFHGPFPGELKDYVYTSDGQFAFDTFEEACAAAKKSRKCRGITQEASTGKFTLRLRKQLKFTGAADKTWVMNGSDVKVAPKKSVFRDLTVAQAASAAPEHQLPKHLDDITKGPFPAVLTDYIRSTDGRYAYPTLAEAVAAARNVKKCRGITKEGPGIFTLRKCRKLQPTDSGELTWIMKDTGVFMRPKAACFDSAKYARSGSDEDEVLDSQEIDSGTSADEDECNGKEIVARIEPSSSISSPQVQQSASVFDLVHGPYEGRLREYAFTEQGECVFTSFENAVRAACGVKNCRGITQEAPNVFTLRRCSKLKPPIDGEITWVMKSATDVDLNAKKRSNAKGKKNGASRKPDSDSSGGDYVDVGQIQLTDMDRQL